MRSIVAFVFGFSVAMAVGYVLLFVEILLAYQRLETILYSLILRDQLGLSKVGLFINQAMIVTAISIALGGLFAYLQRQASARKPLKP